jgi:hypothetical protein
MAEQVKYVWETVADQVMRQGRYRKLRYVRAGDDHATGFVFTMQDGKTWRASTDVIVGTYSTEAEARTALETAVREENNAAE